MKEVLNKINLKLLDIDNKKELIKESIDNQNKITEKQTLIIDNVKYYIENH